MQEACISFAMSEIKWEPRYAKHAHQHYERM